ncbi:MAG: hypothetical protein PHH52_02255 [Patescibacteria group bacterium]|nr:hypothetical protein [Patescibacteria group bacterium]MDD3778183.1 hypothetical protein [Patescibacteria group bacterium]MDD4444078.1 hypothetical protein [Patescibacteria group bacterium]
MKISKSDLQKLITAMENKKLSVSQVIELIEKSNVQSEKVINSTNEIKLVIDYTKTVEQVIADSNYDWKNDDITAQHFPVSPEMIGKKAEVSAKLFHFNRGISSDDVISEMDKAGYRPATLMELLVLGFLFPELQRQFPIVALGSVWHSARGSHHVPYLSVDGSERSLYLLWFGGDWGPHCRFLGVRK